MPELLRYAYVYFDLILGDSTVWTLAVLPTFRTNMLPASSGTEYSENAVGIHRSRSR